MQLGREPSGGGPWLSVKAHTLHTGNPWGFPIPMKWFLDGMV